MKIMCPKCKMQRMKEDYSVPDSDQMYCPECEYTESRKILEDTIECPCPKCFKCSCVDAECVNKEDGICGCASDN